MKRALLVVSTIAVAALHAFGQTTALQVPAFDVAAIRLHDPIPHERSHIVSSDKDGSFVTQNESLLAIVQYTFKIPDSRTLNVPAWMKTLRFDIEAKSDIAVTEKLSKLDWDEATPLKHAMIQNLLAERFKLTVHREMRILPVYELVVSKGGSKLATTKSDGLRIDHSRGRINAQGMTTAAIAQEIAQDAGRVILDKTGLDGRFDVDLRWTSDDTPGSAIDAPPLFTAIEEQLGLKLVPAKGSVEVLVIDHVEMPSAN